MREPAKRRWLLVAAAAAALVVAGYAAASNVVVLLGPTGPQPSLVSVGWGHTLDLVNGDSVAHGLASPRPALNAATVAPGGTFSAVLTGRAGTVSYNQTGPRRFPGTVVVVLSGPVSLRGPAHPVPYGRQLHLSGKTTARIPVAIEERLAGDTAWDTAGTVTSGSNGAFAATLALAVGGRVRAAIDGDQVRSHRVEVSVAPRVTLAAAPHRLPAGSRVLLRARVLPATASRVVYLYACSSLSGKWRRLANRRLSATGIASFHVPAAPGLIRLRATVRQHGAAAGYAAATSRTVSVTGTGTGRTPRVTHHSRHHC
jgi:hypothetical protein